MEGQPGQQRITKLAEKWLDGTISDAEAKEFAQWYDSIAQEDMPVDPAFAKTHKELSGRIFSAVEQATKTKIIPFHRQPVFLRSAAAAILLIISGVFYYNYFAQKTPPAATRIVQQNINAPTQSRAVLTLADGSQVLLDSAADGEIAAQNGMNIIKKDGELMYEPAGVHASVAAFNTVSLPKGSLPVQLKLSDGSKVWLNAASSITYPVVFNSSTREVSITGEAYFDIAKNKLKPFTVVFNQQKIQVLGTAFNINAYTDEPATITTLIEGAVRVHANTQNVMLQAGQQATYKSAKLEAKQVADPDRFIAWKNNRFVFGEQMDIETIMRVIARWYNIEVQYHGKPQLHFGGSLPRNIPLNQLLKTLEKTGGAHFSVVNNTVHVRP